MNIVVGIVNHRFISITINSKLSSVTIPDNPLKHLKSKWPKGPFKLFKRETPLTDQNRNIKFYEFELI